jgi:crotonobetainyl-CoA:carnitine CoA-transferase CaiB-like acyl-CoA transferase
VGALGDISSGLFTVIGILAALRHRDATGEGQHLDVAMYDSTVAMTDIVMNFWSLGVPDEQAAGTGLIETFAANDGHFVIQVVREHHFEALANLVGHPEWLRDPRLATRAGWAAHADTLLRSGIESWARDKTKREAAAELAAAGLAAGPSHTSEEVVADEHIARRNMAVTMEVDGQPAVLVPGNPVKLSAFPEAPEGRVPWLGEDTDEVLAAELGITPMTLEDLRDRGIIG